MDNNLPNQASAPVKPVQNAPSASNPQPPIPPEPIPPRKSFFTRPLIIGVAVFVVLLLGLLVAGMFLTKSEKKAELAKQTPQANVNLSTISGTLGINGVPPIGATVNVMAAETGQSTFTTVVTGLPPAEGAKWSWPTSTPGTLYQVKAQIVSSGQVVGESDPIFIASPATDEVININVNPPAATPTVPQATTTPAPQVLSSISGTFNVNGYVASGATITINARQVGSQSFSPIQTGLPALDQSTWSWTNAVQNASYEIQAVLVNPGGTPTQSQVLTVTAPAVNEVLTLNSTATQPTPAVVGVSGTINLNGQIPGGSYITLGARPTGNGSFSQVATNIQATNGVVWTYTAANSGSSYDLQAYLWINNQPASQSQILTVAAPAANEVLTINASTQPAPPASNTISVSCSNNGVGYQANVNVNANSSITNAVQYLITIGSTGGASDVVNNTITPSNPAQSQSYNSPPNLARGQTYYAQFAFSTCVGCSFSSFSPSVPFTCN